MFFEEINYYVYYICIIDSVNILFITVKLYCIKCYKNKGDLIYTNIYENIRKISNKSFNFNPVTNSNFYKVLFFMSFQHF